MRKITYDTSSRGIKMTEDLGYQLIETTISTKDKAVQDSLIALGWTPPGISAGEVLNNLKADRDLWREDVVRLRRSLQEVKDYYAKQGTGRVFHLGYGGDSKREERLVDALRKSYGI